LQAGIEARTGIPLQVGGVPPRGRVILPGHRLAGAPVWSLPTPETEATVDLFDGGTVVAILFLLGLLATEGVTWRRQVALERSRQTTRDAILQRLSHELRTPAASVRSLVDALDIPGTSEAERQQFRDLARSEAERLSVGIDRLLQAARGEATVRIDPVPLDLAAWAEAVRARWVPRIPDLLLQATHPSPAVADPERLDEAIDALLDNARKYGGPNVTLTVGPGRIQVEDDGQGIPARDRARILQKFERMEGRVNDPGGHGLGLWAVGEVARAHKGSLSIEGPSRFVITLGAS
jgi:signal transduction histidine kinase